MHRILYIKISDMVKGNINKIYLRMESNLRMESSENKITLKH
jgi:hypothetical protein